MTGKKKSVQKKSIGNFTIGKKKTIFLRTSKSLPCFANSAFDLFSKTLFYSNHDRYNNMHYYYLNTVTYTH